MSDKLSKFPTRLDFSGKRSGSVFTIKPGYYAEHHPQAGDTARNAEAFFDQDDIAVFRGEPPQNSFASPVYELQPGGSPAVPSGRIFIRFRDGVKASSRKADIEASGYRFLEEAPYAPNAAWLTSESDSIADALVGISKLEALQDVENVEPQMLMKSSGRAP